MIRSERRRYRVVRAAWLWDRNPTEVREFVAGIGHPTTGKVSVNQAVNGYLFRIREGKSSNRIGMGSAFHLLRPRYGGVVSLTAPTDVGLWKIFTFTLFYDTLFSKLDRTRTDTALGGACCGLIHLT